MSLLITIQDVTPIHSISGLNVVEAPGFVQFKMITDNKIDPKMIL